MIRALICGSALALAAGFAVQAQEPASKPADPPDASASAAAPAKLKTGMMVKDSAGATVGKIASVGDASDASAKVALEVDGKTVDVPASTLSIKGGSAVSTQTKAEIKAAESKPK